MLINVRNVSVISTMRDVTFHIIKEIKSIEIQHIILKFMLLNIV